MYPAKQRQKSNQKDVNNLVPSISMPSLLASKPQLSVAIKSPFDMQRNGWQMKHKTAAETISETRRMLSNGIGFFFLNLCDMFYYFLLLLYFVRCDGFVKFILLYFIWRMKCIECVQSFICRAYTQTQKHILHVSSKRFVIKSDLKRIIILIVNNKKINYFSVPNGTIDDIM